MQLGLAGGGVRINLRSGLIHVGQKELDLPPAGHCLLFFMLLEKALGRPQLTLEELTDPVGQRMGRLRQLYSDLYLNDRDDPDEPLVEPAFFQREDAFDETLPGLYRTHFSRLRNKLKAQLPDSLVGLLAIKNVGNYGNAAYQPAIIKADAIIVERLNDSYR